MPKYHKDDIDKYFDYNIFVPKRMLYLGSRSYNDDGVESGTDHEMFEYFLKGLTFLECIGEDKPIVIHMNNLGGDWYHGMAIYNAIRACQCHITIVAYGYAMSMGSIILQAADTRIIAEDCTLMLHDGEESLSGSVKTVEAWARHSKKIRERMYGIYYQRIKAKKKRITIKKVEEMCVHDHILNAQESVNLGLADSIMESIEIEGIDDGKYKE